MKFTKMQGLGNDYVCINCMQEEIIEKDMTKLVRYLCDRHYGIGADGVLFVKKSDIADMKMEIYNVDGSQAEMCGNGIRCFGKYVYDKKMINKQVITVETKAGIKQLTLELENEEVTKIKVDMGQPIWKDEGIKAKAEQERYKVSLVAEDKEFIGHYVSMGNPHVIILVEDVEQIELEKYGPMLEVNPCFPNKTNVEFVQVLNENTIKMRVWERGVGETNACGTGACGSAVVCTVNELTGSKVRVNLKGGVLEIEYDLENHHIYMTGIATTVFEGEIFPVLK